MNEATVIAYPVNSPSNRHMSNNNLMEENIYASSLGDSKFADDTIEMSGNFFSQLDSMIAAVKVESSALDSMKEKLREVESLRNQISMFTKRLLDADQANLNLKGNLVKVQEMYAEAKKAKAEVESSIVPIRAELNRTKDQCNKERMGRLAAQQQLAGMQDQINMLQQANENLDREVKTIPALTESNEILKNDLSQLRKRYKDEKAQMTKHIKTLETQARDVEAVKGCVRDLSMKLLDIANAGSNIATSGMNSGAGSAAFQAQQAMQQQQQQRYQQQAQQQPRYVPPHLQHQPPPHHQQQQLQQQQQQQSNVYYQYGFNPNNSGNSNNNGGAIHSSSTAANHSSSTAANHSNGSDDENSYEDADDESYDPDDSEQNLTNEYENESFVEVNSSIESAGSVALISKAGAAVKNANNSNSGGGSGGGGGKKKKGVRRVGGAGAGAAQGNVVRQARVSQPQPRMMQQLDPSGSNNNMGAPGQYQQPPPQQQQQYRNTTGSASNNNINYNNGGQQQQQQQQQGMVSSVSLPRI